MKIKKHIFTILFVVFMVTTFCIGIIRFYEWKESSHKISIEEQEKCQKLEGNYLSDAHEEYCEKLLNYSVNETEDDFFDVLLYVEDYMPLSSNFIVIIFLVVASCFYNSKYLKNNIVAYDLTRENYKKVKLNIFANAWIPALVIPCVFIIRLIVYYSMTHNFNFNINRVMWGNDSLSNIGAFLTAYILIALFDALIYANICLIVNRKKHHFILAPMLSYLVIIGLELFLEVFVGGLICTNLFNSDIGIIFNIMNFGRFNDSYGLFAATIVPVVIFIITLVIVEVLYKDKEKLLIDCESND